MHNHVCNTYEPGTLLMSLSSLRGSDSPTGFKFLSLQVLPTPSLSLSLRLSLLSVSLRLSESEALSESLSGCHGHGLSLSVSLALRMPGRVSLAPSLRFRESLRLFLPRVSLSGSLSLSSPLPSLLSLLYLGLFRVSGYSFGRRSDDSEHWQA